MNAQPVDRKKFLEICNNTITRIVKLKADYKTMLIHMNRRTKKKWFSKKVVVETDEQVLNRLRFIADSALTAIDNLGKKVRGLRDVAQLSTSDVIMVTPEDTENLLFETDEYRRETEVKAYFAKHGLDNVKVKK